MTDSQVGADSGGSTGEANRVITPMTRFRPQQVLGAKSETYGPMACPTLSADLSIPERLPTNIFLNRQHQKLTPLPGGNVSTGEYEMDTSDIFTVRARTCVLVAKYISGQ